MCASSYSTLNGKLDQMHRATRTLIQVSVRQRNRHDLDQVLECLPPRGHVLGHREPSDQGLNVLDLFVHGGWKRHLRVEEVLPYLSEQHLEGNHASRKVHGVVALDGERDELHQPRLRAAVGVGRKAPSQPGGEGGIVLRAVVGDGLQRCDASDVVPRVAYLTESEHVRLVRKEASVATAAATHGNQAILQA